MPPTYPWLQLKLAEEVLRRRFWRKNETEAILVLHFSALLEECSNDPGAEESVVYHASMALQHELNNETEAAITCRKKEISLIERLLELATSNPNDRPALWLYDDEELADRRHMLAQLQSAGKKQ